MRDLVPCTGCYRLLRHREARCPFCLAVRVVAAAVLPLSVACHKASTDGADGAASTSASAATSASSVTAEPEPSTSAAPLPSLAVSAAPSASAVASAKLAAIGRDAGAADPGLLAILGPGVLSGDAGLGLLTSPGIGAYGGPPPPGLNGGLPAPTIVASAGSGHTDGDPRVVAGHRPQFRACYAKGLAANPDMSGKVKLQVTVAKDGTATSRVASASGNLSAGVQQCMALVMTHATFPVDEPHVFEIDITATTNP